MYKRRNFLSFKNTCSCLFEMKCFFKLNCKQNVIGLRNCTVYLLSLNNVYKVYHAKRVKKLLLIWSVVIQNMLLKLLIKLFCFPDMISSALFLIAKRDPLSWIKITASLVNLHGNIQKFCFCLWKAKLLLFGFGPISISCLLKSWRKCWLIKTSAKVLKDSLSNLNHNYIAFGNFSLSVSL